MSRSVIIFVGIACAVLFASAAEAQLLPGYPMTARRARLYPKISSRCVDLNEALSSNLVDTELSMSARRVNLKQRLSSRTVCADSLSSRCVFVKRKLGFQFPTPVDK